MSNIQNLSRREVLRIAGAAVAASTVAHSAYPATAFSMPGLYPGLVVGVEHSGSSIGNVYQAGPIQLMIRRGMMELTGCSNYVAGWRKLFQPGDVVAIKANPNGCPLFISSQACLMEIIQGLLLAGIAPNNIVVCERYQDILLRITGWLPSWVRTAYASPGDYLADQTAIDGYDPEYYVNLPQYLQPWQNVNNLAHTRSYAALFVTRRVTKIISLAVLKDHELGGVTLGLKNLSIGCWNNSNRAHPDDGRLFLKDFIPALVAAPVIRNKTVLSIIDGVHGLYAGGPMGWTGRGWEHRTMYFATDVVAGDRVGWRAIDTERAKWGLEPEQTAPADADDPAPVRQPQHIEVAGQMGLGEWRDDGHIDFRKIVLA